jgi:hypothetical protein
MSTHEIEIEYGERYTEFVMGMYVDSSLVDDIDILGWNLCGCDDSVFQEKVGNCRIVSSNLRNGLMEAIVELHGWDKDLQDKVIEEFLDCWDDFVRNQYQGMISRTR